MSDLLSIATELQFSNYMGFVIFTAVTYDCIITFPKEIYFVWNRSWTFVSLMFVLVRYLGLILAFIDAFYQTSIIPGPIVVSIVIIQIRVWAFVLFLAAADIVMVLRVHAIYGRSKIVLGVLLVFYVATIILYAISGEYYNDPNTNMTMTIAQVFNMSFCNPTYSVSSRFGYLKLIPRVILAVLMLILVLAHLCMDFFRSYKTSKQWSVNKYIKLFSREGVLYFFGHLLYMIDFGNTIFGTILSTLSIIVMYILSPRFIMNVRELYSHNLDKWNKGIDSGFGVWKSQSTASPEQESVEFTDRTQIEGEEMGDASLTRNTHDIA